MKSGKTSAVTGAWRLSRREVMLLGAVATLAGLPAGAASSRRVQAFPLEAVRLKPSPYLDAVEANRAYLHRLEPDRLLHNFRRFAGLEPRAAAYGGWEADTIAGHTLGHYLSALALMHAQTGDAECRRRADYIVEELSECQRRSPAGYVAGVTRRRGDIIEDGRVIFEELARGEIRSAPFNLNGCWVPFYNWHKLFAGLFDAQRYCRNARALAIATALGGFIESVFAGLDDAGLQTVLDCEHGGINESFAELHARTGDRRWLALAQRLYHRRILEPLAAGRDELAHVHSNTQIPKLIGLARLHELTGEPGYAAAAGFFWRRVTGQHSYVVGGNGDREYFQEPGSISRYITEQTCEACCTYNMLKLTRHLYQWRPDASYFDYYERAHLNHILAHQDPGTGMLAYMMPLMSGSARDFSTAFHDFWCCVGSGMESHARHGDSIYWRAPRELYMNLYIPSRLEWTQERVTLELDSGLPLTGESSLRIVKLAKPRRFAVSLRIPAWAEGWNLKINGKDFRAVGRRGYVTLQRRWKAGDVVELSTPLALRLEATPDDPATVAVLRGPLVLAADLGPKSQPVDGVAPALIGTKVLEGFRAGAEPAVYEVNDPEHSSRVARQELDGQHPARFVEIEYRIPEALTRGKPVIRVRFEPVRDRTAGPVFGCRLLAG